MATIAVIIFALCFSKAHLQFVCNEKLHPDVILELPPIIHCENSQFVETDISIKKVNDADYISEGIIVSAKNYECTVHASINIFSSYVYKEIKYITLSKESILKMNETLRYNDQQFVYDEVSFKYILGIPAYQCVSYFFTQHTTANTYITLQRTDIHYKNHLMHTELGSLSSCEYSSKFCKIFNDLYIVWDIQDENALKDYNYYNNVKGYMIYDENDNIHISFKDMHSNVNISVVIDNITNVDEENYIYTSNFAYRIKFNNKIMDSNNNYVINPKKQKRSLDSGDKTDMLQYLYTISDINFNMVFELCHEMAISTMELFALCSVSPNECISSLINDTNIHVSVVGNKYLVNKCNSVSINRFLPSNNGNNECSIFPKVEILLQGNLITGFYDIRTSQIYSLTKYTSNCNTIVFECIDDKNSLCLYDHYTGNITRYNITNIINLGFQNNLDVKPPNFNLSEFKSMPTLSDISAYINTNMHITKNIEHYSIKVEAIVIIVLLSIFTTGLFVVIALFGMKLYLLHKNK